MRFHRGFGSIALAGLAGSLALLGAGAATTAPELISRVPGNQGADDGSYEAAVTPNGRYVAFWSVATNLINGNGDTNGNEDVFVRDRKAGTTELVSVDSDGNQGNNDSEYPCISANGRFALFQTYASNFADDDVAGYRDICLHDRKTGETRLVSRTAEGDLGDAHSSLYGACLSANGRYATFYSSADNLAGGATNDYQVLLVDLKTGVLTLVSQDAGGALGDDDSYNPSISANGRFVAYYTHATNLFADDVNSSADILVYDRKTGTTRVASVASDGTLSDGFSYDPAVSNNGNVVAFYSGATNLVPGDTNAGYDTFLHDFRSGETRRISVDADGTEVAGSNYEPAISQSGKTVVFYSEADGLVPEDANGTGDVFTYDVPSGTLRLLSADSQGTVGDGYSYLDAACLSFNGKWCAFPSAATNFSNQDKNGNVYDAYLVPAK